MTERVRAMASREVAMVTKVRGNKEGEGDKAMTMVTRVVSNHHQRRWQAMKTASAARAITVATKRAIA